MPPKTRAPDRFRCDHVEATARVPRCGDRVDEVLHRAFDAADLRAGRRPAVHSAEIRIEFEGIDAAPGLAVDAEVTTGELRWSVAKRRTWPRRRSRCTRAGGCMRMDQCACCGTAISRGRRPVAAPSVSTRTARARSRFRATVWAAYHADAARAAPGELRSRFGRGACQQLRCVLPRFRRRRPPRRDVPGHDRCDRRGSTSRRRRARTG